MRSALFVPGDSHKKLSKSVELGADALFIDLEDSVALDNKAAARDIALGFLSDLQKQTERPRLFIRVNDFSTGLTGDDLNSVMAAKPDGIVLPKSNHGQDVTRLDVELRVREAECGIDDGATQIVAITTETALGVLNAGTYPEASARLVGMAWGAEDLSSDVGALHRRYENGTYRDLFRFARLQTLLGANAAGVDPLDTVYPDFKDEVGLETECREAMIDGFRGKMAIHPSQVAVINEIFTPSASDIAKAKAVVKAFSEAGYPGVLAVDGEMLDRPHLLKAERLLQRHNR